VAARMSLRYGPNERRILAFSGIAHFAVHFFEQMFPTAAVGIALDAGLPVERVLAWSFLGYLLFGLGALPAGLLTDRWQARRMLQVCLVGTGAGALLVAVSPTGPGIAAALGVLGLCSSIYHPAGMSLIASGVRERGRALGLNGIFGNVGIAGAPAAAALTIAFVGWRATYALYGAALVLTGLVLLAAPMEEPPRAAASERHESTAGASAGVLFAVLCVCITLAGIAYRGTSLAMPAYFAGRFSPTHYGIATSVVYLFGTISQYWGGRLADRHDLRWLYLAFQTASLPALAAMAWLTGLPLVVAGAAFVFFSLGMQPIENSLVARLAPPAWRSTSYGIKFVLTFGVGSIAVWIVKSAPELSSVFWILALVVAALVGFAMLLIALSGRSAVRNLPAGVELVPGT
jgi:MFS family permease